MRLKKIVRKFWRDIDARRWDNLAGYFSKGARVDWPNTGESFDQDGFRDAKSADQDYWAAEVEKVVRAGKLVVSVAKVRNNAASFHVTSFFAFKSKKIASLVEYWGEDGRAISQRAGNDDGEPQAGGAEMGDPLEAGPGGSETQKNTANSKKQNARAVYAETPIVDRGKPVKKSAWTRLFFPDDAM
ncbi:MAG: hypothetical protein LBF92_07720 [Synergistaceae bacterium]|jgi:hypothetical protein|nr:hypothetical protein [Synergistaceae bacterium]